MTDEIANVDRNVARIVNVLRKHARAWGNDYSCPTRSREANRAADTAINILAYIEDRDAEIAALRAKLAAMREPLWMLREEHEAETADLRARLEAAENRHAEPCRECSAQGMIESVGMEHGSGCTDSRCCSDCPVPVQVLEPCGACGGYGAIMVPNVPLPETEP